MWVISSSIDGHVGCFHLSPLVNNAAVDILYKFLFEHLFSFLWGFSLRVESLGQIVTVCLTCWGTSKLASTSSPAMCKGSDFPTSGLSLDQLLTPTLALVRIKVEAVSHPKHFLSHRVLLCMECGMASFRRAMERAVSAWNFFWPAWHYPCEENSKSHQPTGWQSPWASGSGKHTNVWASWRQPLRTHVVPIRRVPHSICLSTTYYYWQSTLPSNLQEHSLCLRMRPDWKHWVWLGPACTAASAVKYGRCVKTVSLPQCPEFPVSEWVLLNS